MAGSTVALVRSISAPTALEEIELPGRGTVRLKREDLGPNGTFKWRGALAALDEYRRAGAAGVVTASTGNHGAAVAWAANQLGLTAHVFLPERPNPAKRQQIAAHGAELHEVGPSLAAAATEAAAFAERSGLPYFEDGGTEAQLAGTSTVGIEIAEAGEVAAVFVPVACGALAGGVARALQAAASPAPVIGVQSDRFSRMTTRFHDRGYSPRGLPTFADGLADDRIVEPAFTTCMDLLTDLISVDEEQLRDGVRLLWRQAGIVAEGAGAAALAGFMAREWSLPVGTPVIVVSGRNLDPAVGRDLLGPGAPL